MDRRDVLKILGLGAFGAGGYVVSTSDTDGPPIPDDLPAPHTSTESQTPLSRDNQSQLSLSERIARIDERNIQTPVMRNRLTFDYKPLDEEFESQKLFEKVTATPAEGNDGDRVKMKPGSVGADELAAMIRAMHGVGTGTSVTAGAGEKKADLTGGTHAGVAALIGIYTPPEGSDQVLATRGHSLETARKLASSWNI